MSFDSTDPAADKIKALADTTLQLLQLHQESAARIAALQAATQGLAVGHPLPGMAAQAIRVSMTVQSALPSPALVAAFNEVLRPILGALDRAAESPQEKP